MDGVSRGHWVPWSTALLLTVGSALLLSGSGPLMSPARHAVATPVSAVELMVEGDRRLAAGDFSGALQAYDDALARDPSDLALYYRAGVALSHLKNREQTVAMFLWVVRRGAPEREEVRLAREWLEAARVLTPPERAAASSRR